MWAAMEGYINICKLLIDNGANLEQSSADDHTPLHYAAENGHLDTC